MDSFEDNQALSASSRSKNQIYEQPKTHKRNKKFCDYLNCCSSFENDLSQPELSLFYALKPFCNELYDENNQTHQNKLLEIYFLYFEKPLDEKDLNTEDWMLLGFQSKNAQTDFRGAGLLGLENIREFIVKNKQIMDEMALKENEFLFAMTSLNISFYLKNYFHLADYLTYEKDKLVFCSRDALKNFGRVLENSSKLNLKKEATPLDIARNVIYEIHEVLLIFCFKKWTHLKKIRKDIVFMDFYLVFEEMKRFHNDIFNADEMGSVPQMRDFFKKLLDKNQQKEEKKNDSES